MNRKAFGLILLGVVLAACATVEYTGRRQLSLISASQEKELGGDAYEEIRKKYPLSKNRAYQARIREVGRRIQLVAERPDFDWEFNVLEGKEINAFCLPGGKVAFWEGIMPITGDATGDAVVMGHEVAHALARHGAERMSQALGAQVIGEILAAGVGKIKPGFRDDFLKLYGAGATLGLVLPWGRAQESEADHIGLILMAKAGYDPRAAVGFWQRMSQAAKGQKPPEFLSTHPSDERRIQQIKQWLPEALQHYRGG
ncbi:MAG: M48 family metallopeptidase [Deltaproteobacteria bacterium]|nr:M48 family metallopeptidase [Deltaproteobacteria bacterium]